MSDVSNKILQGLDKIERDKNVKILGAWESGSRSWAIQSPDSDYDVRFIYVRPFQHYLLLNPQSDTIGIMDTDLNIDYQGWDLKKTLNLAAGSNPSLLEWLSSPITYVEDEEFVGMLRYAVAEFNPQAMMQHYASTALKQMKAYWHGDDPVRLKKYMYAIRPLLCVRWMSAHDYEMPPMPVHDLLPIVPHVMSGQAGLDLLRLLSLKEQSSEMGEGRFPNLDAWLEGEVAMARLLASEAPKRSVDGKQIQMIFNHVLKV